MHTPIEDLDFKTVKQQIQKKLYLKSLSNPEGEGGRLAKH